ncbi:Cell division cycle and apoptosis regulator protein 1 [Eumeta japonica]|uniref:Cell division cycle and apoptosis regulator protein 1 n=1 Tax=Eumeta variegata TaxID=151549 RepID=A0A4C1SXJ5_EUMVA|nr:Cell division cycle and apoptosis regulator protein 1 [Eumeta japonica]
MGDIVILDEYDSSKCIEESNLKEMTERKISTYHVIIPPAAPHIIVHPNRLAKGGKFDCAIVSLAMLLDYHPDDSKERFFEETKEKVTKKEKHSKKDSKSSNSEKSGKEHKTDDTISIKSDSRKRKLSTSTSTIANGKDHDDKNGSG